MEDKPAFFTRLDAARLTSANSSKHISSRTTNATATRMVGFEMAEGKTPDTLGENSIAMNPEPIQEASAMISRTAPRKMLTSTDNPITARTT